MTIWTWLFGLPSVLRMKGREGMRTTKKISRITTTLRCSDSRIILRATAHSRDQDRHSTTATPAVPSTHTIHPSAGQGS